MELIQNGLLSLSISPTWKDACSFSQFKCHLDSEIALKFSEYLQDEIAPRKLNRSTINCIFMLLAFGLDPRCKPQTPDENKFKLQLESTTPSLTKKLINVLISSHPDEFSSELEYEELVLLSVNHLLGFEEHIAGFKTFFRVFVYSNLTKLLKRHYYILLSKAFPHEISEAIIVRLQAIVHGGNSELSILALKSKDLSFEGIKVIRVLSTFVQHLSVMVLLLAPVIDAQILTIAVETLIDTVGEVHALSFDDKIAIEKEKVINSVISAFVPSVCSQEGQTCQCFGRRQGFFHNSYGLLHFLNPRGSNGIAKPDITGVVIVLCRLLSHGTPSSELARNFNPEGNLVRDFEKNLCFDQWLEGWVCRFHGEALEELSHKKRTGRPGIMCLLKYTSEFGLLPFLARIAASNANELQLAVIRGCSHSQPFARELWILSTILLFDCGDASLKRALIDTFLGVICNSKCKEPYKEALACAVERMVFGSTTSTEHIDFMQEILHKSLSENPFQPHLIKLFIRLTNSVDFVLQPYSDSLCNNFDSRTDASQTLTLNCLEKLIAVLGENQKKFIGDILQLTLHLISKCIVQEQILQVLIELGKKGALRLHTDEILDFIVSLFPPNRNARFDILCSTCKLLKLLSAGQFPRTEIAQKAVQVVLTAAFSSKNWAVISCGADTLEFLCQIVAPDFAKFLASLLPSAYLPWFKARIKHMAVCVQTGLPFPSEPIRSAAAIESNRLFMSSIWNAPVKSYFLNEDELTMSICKGQSLESLHEQVGAILTTCNDKETHLISDVHWNSTDESIKILFRRNL